MLPQQPVGPQLLSVPQTLGFLAGQIADPHDGFVGDAPGLAGTWQLPQGCLQAKPQALSDAQHHRIPVHSSGRGIGLIAHAIGGVEQNRGPHRSPLFFAAGSPHSFQAAALFRGQPELRTTPGKGHALLKHFLPLMSSYLENDDLGTLVSRRRIWPPRSAIAVMESSRKSALANMDLETAPQLLD